MQVHLKLVRAILSGDEQLLDVSLLGEGRVVDPVRFPAVRGDAAQGDPGPGAGCG